ncbi:MAG: hypothetical protein JWO89_573, partial [Verrucomicrobiaceae bacterium]|nr:hypothetical protein [Verrucomicrobiaceae bacterium]
PAPFRISGVLITSTSLAYLHRDSLGPLLGHVPRRSRGATTAARVDAAATAAAAVAAIFSAAAATGAIARAGSIAVRVIVTAACTKKEYRGGCNNCECMFHGSGMRLNCCLGHQAFGGVSRAGKEAAVFKIENSAQLAVSEN